MITTLDFTPTEGVFRVPTRSIVVQGDGRLILISPVRLTDDHVAKLRGLGEVTDIVAPCLFHHLSVPRAMELFPKAKVWGVPGFEKKRPDIRWSATLTPESWPYKGLLDAVFLEGAPKLNEVEFFHRESRTLIATDLCFNLRKPGGWGSKMFKLFGTYDGFAVSRVLGMLTKDRAKMRSSVAKVLEWDFDRILMGHGLAVDSGGKELLRQALAKRGWV